MANNPVAQPDGVIEGLTFDDFSRVNRLRCESPQGFNHPLESWEYEQWTNALAGEAGEACNVSKKLLRHRQSIAGNHGDDLNVEALKRKLAGELADVIIYADLAIQRLGLTTAQVVTDTFNAKSRQLECAITVPPAPNSVAGKARRVVVIVTERAKELRRMAQASLLDGTAIREFER